MTGDTQDWKFLANILSRPSPGGWIITGYPLQKSLPISQETFNLNLITIEPFYMFNDINQRDSKRFEIFLFLPFERFDELINIFFYEVQNGLNGIKPGLLIKIQGSPKVVPGTVG